MSVLPACMQVSLHHAGCQIPWNWSQGQPLATTWVPGIETMSSTRAPSAPSH